MNVLNSLQGIVSALLGNVLIGASPAGLHITSLVVLVLIAIGFLIALPELVLVIVVIFVLLYLTGVIK